MRIPLESHSAEIEVKRSRFIAIAEPVDSLRDVRAMVARTRSAHPQANHVVHAAVVGTDAALFSMSDDHEPKNTAGRPALEVLRGSGITNILVMVVRYFGGTLLGTGGLVKAYGDAVKTVLDGLKTAELVEKTSITITLGYEMYDQVRKILEDNKALTSEEFTTEVTILAVIPSQCVESVVSMITDTTSGQACIVRH